MQLYVPTAARAGAPKEQCHSFILRVSQKVNAMRPHNLLHLLHQGALRPHDLLQLGQGLLLERDAFSMRLPTQPLDVVPAVLCVAVQRPQEQQPRANRPRVVLEKILLSQRHGLEIGFGDVEGYPGTDVMQKGLVGPLGQGPVRPRRLLPCARGPCRASTPPAPRAYI